MIVCPSLLSLLLFIIILAWRKCLVSCSSWRSLENQWMPFEGGC